MSPKKPALLSGVKPSGDFTIGNYIGAVRNWKLMQESYESFFMIADLHSITVRQDPEELRKRIYDIFALYIACGLDPNKATLFLQSHVPAHAELGWILHCFTYMGELSRMTQFKDKVAKHETNNNAGLFAYPVLMAADILLYQPKAIPVGEDQKQHIELTRDVAERFNSLYGETFSIPDPFIPEEGARIMGLQNPEAKMSKSDTNPKDCILLLDSPDVIRSKCKSAVTDTVGIVAYDPARPGISNLITIFSIFSGKSKEALASEYEGKGYGQFKGDLAEVIIAVLEPIQKRYAELREDSTMMEAMMKAGAAKASVVANATLREVYQKIGFVCAS